MNLQHEVFRPSAQEGMAVRQCLALSGSTTMSSSATDSRCRCNRFQFQRRIRIADGRALENVSLEKRQDAAESLKLRGVDQFVRNQRAITPVIRANKNSILQCQTARSGSEKIN